MSDKQWLLAGMLAMLVGCGAERDEPFDPGTTIDDEDDEDVVSVSVSKVLDGDNTLLEIDGQKQVLVFRNEDDYWLFLDRYSDTLPVNEPDFTDGQVVLIDLGEREDNNCEDYLSLESVRAQEAGDNTAKLVLQYDENTASTDEEACPEEDAETLRPYYFYHVETRRELIVSEALQ